MLNKYFPPKHTYNYIYGTDNDDTITGTAGDDVIYGGEGSDLMVGGKGNDWFYGGKGDDHYYVQDAGDVVVEYADEGSDMVYSYLADYTLGSNVEGLDLMGDAQNGTGNELNNYMAGNDKNNILTGLGGNDYIDGGKGADIMLGGFGDDQYRVDNVGDVIWEISDQGTDSVTSTISYVLGPNLENLFLAQGAGAINGTGNGLDNTLCGNVSNNVLKGEGGNDYINGLGGQDKMYGGTGDDYFVVDSTSDVVVEYANEGYDTVYSTATFFMPSNVEFLIMDGPNAIGGYGNGQDNSILGSSANNIINGFGGHDVLFGAGGNDTIDGGLGEDVVNGGKDNDILTGGANNDTFMFTQNFGHDTVTDFKAGGDADVIEFYTNVFADFAAVQNAMQQVGNDTVITLDADNTITLQNVNAANLHASDFGFIV